MSGAAPAPTPAPEETFSKDATVTGTYFEVTRPATNEGGRFVIRTLKTLEESDAERTEILTVRIGRLTVDITLRQVHDGDHPWQDGGDFVF